MLSPVMCLVRAWWPLALLQLTEHEPQLDQELTRQTPGREGFTSNSEAK